MPHVPGYLILVNRRPDGCLLVQPVTAMLRCAYRLEHVLGTLPAVIAKQILGGHVLMTWPAATVVDARALTHPVKLTHVLISRISSVRV